jgi:hypothetical protein
MHLNRCPGGGSHLWWDALPGIWCDSHREMRDQQREAEKEKRAERARLASKRSLKAAELEYLDAVGKWDPYFQRPRSAVAAAADPFHQRKEGPRETRQRRKSL